MSNYLTYDDYNSYGPDLVDLSQRAAKHALAPELQRIQQQNAELQRRLAVESRRRLDAAVAAAVPNFQSIDADPRWHRWLLGIDSLSGRVRQTLLNDAINSGSDQRIAHFFRTFEREHGSPSSSGTQAANTTRPTPFGTRPNSIGNRTYTRQQIHDLYEKKRRGDYAKRPEEWARIEQDIFNAQHESRILATPYLTK
jgi:hypothetical protein